MAPASPFCEYFKFKGGSDGFDGDRVDNADGAGDGDGDGDEDGGGDDDKYNGDDNGDDNGGDNGDERSKDATHLQVASSNFETEQTWSRITHITYFHHPNHHHYVLHRDHHH